MSEVPKNKFGKRIHRLVLTGGPCGGKTTAQQQLIIALENLGWKVYTVPEMATLMITAGIKPGEMTDDERLQFNIDMIKLMINFEDSVINSARFQQKDVVIICDRGCTDIKGYVSAEQWAKIKEINKWSDADLCEKRYDTVIHFVTAADGAEKFYTTANNSARSESAEVAKERDLRLQEAWIGHPYLDIIENSKLGFADKMKRALRCIFNRLGVDYQMDVGAIKRKWLVKNVAPNAALPAKIEEFEVQEFYLISDSENVQTRIRKRGRPNGSADSCSYQQTVRRTGQDGRVLDTRKALTKSDFEELYATQRDHSHADVLIRRRNFCVNRQYFQWDLLENPKLPTTSMILTTYGSPDVEPVLPDFLELGDEVTNNIAFSMFMLSKVK